MLSNSGTREDLWCFKDSFFYIMTPTTPRGHCSIIRVVGRPSSASPQHSSSKAACLKTFWLHFVSCWRRVSVNDPLPPVTLQRSDGKPKTITISPFPSVKEAAAATQDQFTRALQCQTRVRERMLTLAWSRLL